MTGSRCGWLGKNVAALLLVVALPGLALAESDLSASMAKASREPAVIKGQLRMAADLGRQVLAGLQAAPSDESVPLDQSLHKAARNTYVLIRAARHGMVLIKEWNEGRKGVLPDPVFELAFRRVDNAWDLSRTAVDGWGSSSGRPEYLRRSTEDLGRALQLIDQALALMP